MHRSLLLAQTPTLTMVKKKTVKRKNKKVAKNIPKAIQPKVAPNTKYINFKKKVLKSISSFFEKHSLKIDSAKQLSLIILGYGTLINIPAYTFFKFDFSFLTVISFGIIAYLIKDDFVEWIRRIIAKR